MTLTASPWRTGAAAKDVAIAVASLATALGLGAGLERLLGMSPQVSLLLCTIMFVAWAGGPRAAVVAAGLAVLAFDYFFLEPVYSFRVHSVMLPRLGFFVVAATFVVVLSAAYRRAERKASDAERDLQLTIDMIPAMVAIHAAGGARTFVNQGWKSYTGLTFEGARAANWHFFHPDDAERAAREWEIASANGEPFEVEARLRRADGQYRWYMIRRVPLRDDKGNVLRWYGIGFDIEDRKRAEAALKTSEAGLANAERDLQLTIDTIPALVARYSHDGKRDFVNAAWKRYTGLSDEEAVRVKRSSTLHPEDAPVAERLWTEALAKGERVRNEQRIRRGDGAYRWHLIDRIPLFDEHGRVARWYVTSYDIDDQKRAERALQRSEAYLAEAQKLSSTGSFGWAIGSNEIVWSDETYAITGYDRGIAPSRDLILQRTHPDDRDLLLRHLERLQQGPQSIDFQHRLLMPDGAVKHLQVRAHRVRYTPGQEEMVGAVMDVTQTRQAQEALQAAHADLAHASRIATLGEISASIAHEVNQPLAAIVANGQACLRFLRREVPDLNDVRGTVECMVSDGNRASEVIKRVRGLMKKADPQILALDVNDVIREVAGLLQREILTQRVALRLELAADLPIVAADRVQIQQVIINLVMNGIEAMRASEQRELLIRSREDEEQRVVIAVIDRGAGFSGQDPARMFDAFFSTKPNGLGMGLSICQSIVASHGGSIWAVANGGPGATFQFALPLHPEPPPEDAGAGRRSRILEESGATPI